MLDFYLWVYLKVVVYRGKLTTLHELKVAIETEIARVPTEICKVSFTTSNEELRKFWTSKVATLSIIL